MSASSNKSTLNQRLFLGTLLVLTVFGMIALFLQYQFLRRTMIANTLETAGALLYETEAVREYVHRTLRPRMYAMVPDETFVPDTMSSTVVSRAVTNRFRTRFSEFVFRRVSLNPRNPANRADPAEEPIFDRFAADPDRDFWQGRITWEGNVFLAAALPNYHEPACLRCHGDPADAPQEMIDIYDDFGGFRFEAGDLGGISAVYIPLALPLAGLRHRMLILAGGTVIALALFLIALYFLQRKTVITPIHRMIRRIGHPGESTGEKSDTAGFENELAYLEETVTHLNTYVRLARKGATSEANILGPYVLSQPMAAGNFTWLYHARDTRNEQPVVLKAPFPEILFNPVYTRCLHRELAGFERIRHPNLPTVVARTDDLLALTPFSGEDLASRLEEHLPGKEEIRSIFKQLCDLVAVLHSAGIVHHDLRPEWMMISEDGRLQLIDLGLAAVRNDPAPLDPNLPGPQGDRRHMAPEQLAGRRGDPRSDIYTLGVLLYRMCTGALPVERVNETPKEYRRWKADFPRPSERDPDVHSEMEKVILKAMAWNPEERYQWVEDFWEDLDGAI